MKGVLVTLAMMGWSGVALAQSTDCGAQGPAPKSGEIKIVSWNIQELATAVKVYDRPIRSDDDFRDLRMYRECHDADVYVLQEIASLRALGRVFPPSRYILCISGQTIADQRGLSPDYPASQLAGIEPQCNFNPGTPVSSLPGELTNPARQYVALAIKRASGIALTARSDVPALGPKDPVNDHQTRWALDATISKGGASMRLLVVHMKSGCTEDPIEEDSSNDNCPALYRQLDPLKSWLHAADQTGLPILVIGDFNRRLDREDGQVKATDMWDVINGAATVSPGDNVNLLHIPKNKEFKCWPSQPAVMRFPIDFFILNQKAQGIADPNSYWKWRYGKDVEEGTPIAKGPSDHCPIQLNLVFP